MMRRPKKGSGVIFRPMRRSGCKCASSIALRPRPGKKGSGVIFCGRTAFTLLEVIIAIALTLALLGAMFGFLFNLLSTRAAVIETSMRQSAAEALFDHLERDLAHCLVGDGVLGAGVEGDGASVRILSRQVAIAAGDAATVASSFADVQRTEYRFDEATRRLEARRMNPIDSRTANAAYESLGIDIFRVRFRYYDGAAWSESFDSLAADRLPVAVEVSIWHDPWPGEEVSATDTDTSADSAASARRTFDANAGFDEAREAMLSDLDLDERPDPDHRRLILVPDAAPGLAAGGGGGGAP